MAKITLFDGLAHCPTCLGIHIKPNAGQLIPGAKPSNPKYALGVKKVPLHCIPSGPVLEMGLAMMEGGRKYGTHNYRAIGVRTSTYYDAVMRHLIAWWEGEDIDPDSGIHHVVKAMACLLVLRDSMLMGNCEDDRPMKYTNGLDMSKFNQLAADVVEKYPECVKGFTEKRRKKEHSPEPEEILSTTAEFGETKPGYGGNVQEIK
jgi:hypothetical protein